MLLFLTQYLSETITFFNVFNYLSMRAILGVLTALSINFLVGPFMIRRLNVLKIGQAIRDDGPSSHLIKAGTPTMGGTLILFSIFISAFLWSDLTNDYVWVVLFTTFSFGVIGFIDDYKKIKFNSSDGLSVKVKYSLQSVVALIVACYLYNTADHVQELNYIIPFFKNVSLDLGLGFIIITYFVIVGASNGVNLTDGLDGLAIIPSCLIGGALGIIAYLSGNAINASYLHIPFISDAGELLIFCSALCGASIGFLWFNTYPAQVFMGDVGALALGAALGTIAVIIRHEVVFFIMAGIFVIETLSVIIQVVSFKLTGKRVFRMAPLHHHYELKGWAEPKVIVRFWIITVMLVLFGLATLKLR